MIIGRKWVKAKSANTLITLRMGCLRFEPSERPIDVNKILLLQGDALAVLKSLPSDSVHCCVCSPPYLGLRDYGCEGQLGLESTPEQHIDALITIFRELRRVLHPSATFFLNYGDSYRAKQLLGMPWRIALALQKDGWWLRSDIIWEKRNAMPSSVDDRPGVNHEYLFMLTKSDRYYYDRDATRIITGNEATWEEYVSNAGASYHLHSADEVEGMQQKKRGGFKNMTHPLGASRRTVWSIPTERSKYKHYATFAKKLVEPCIQAGTSAGGCCPFCLQPWIRIYEDLGFSDHGARHKRPDAPGAELSQVSSLRTGKIKVKKPIGWKKDCDCPNAEPQPCTVLDCFSGTGTTGVVAARLGRSYIGIELDPQQIENAYDNLSTDMPLLNEIEVDQIA